MGNVHIVTDSTADLSWDEIDRYNLHVVPLTIQAGGELYQDRVDLEPETFLEIMAKSDELPKSSQPAPGVLSDLYSRLGKEGDQIVSIHMTGGMSGTADAARQAAAMTEADVTVIDSRFISRALAFQVLEAAGLSAEGATASEIASRLAEVRKATSLFVVVDTLENLVKGGRIGKGRALLGSFLKIKPIASLEGGEYTPVHKARSHRQAVSYLFDRFKEETAGKTVKGIGIVHAGGQAMAEPLERMLADAGFPGAGKGYTSPVIATHTGPGAIGFMYFAE
ncbi:DegV family protein [Indiicoccus explosivorum]|uniref:DegV family protein n=1 Tax=Indiicoccus explosivorum TaxID=1917864 RepID=UPI000B438E6D|nr:DegV family protein [Indiicoccus explosivorum]